jgi:glycosyltransferase involved in cell wall biosynthesis
MKIHSICLVKNEADVIVQSLTAAAQWSDHIYVYDNGSTDGTWEKVHALSAKLSQIIPFKQDDRPFDDTLRREPFEYFRGQSDPGDWWCASLDADEFYIDSPRLFLEAVPLPYDVVWFACFQYYFTDRDAALFERRPELYGDDVPVAEKCRYYSVNWSEPGFFRYSEALRWTGRFPSPLKYAWPHRIRMKHYQYRSPAQIEMRLRTRRAAMARGIFLHEVQQNWSAAIAGAFRPRREQRLPESWRERIVDSSTLTYDTGMDYAMDESKLPPVTDLNPSPLTRVRNRLARLAPGFTW